MCWCVSPKGSLHRDGRVPNLVHEKLIGPWLVEEALELRLVIFVTMQGQKERTRWVPTALVKIFFERLRNLRYPVEDEFAQKHRKLI